MAQHDYSIANQSGASFRSDLNNALSAIVSQNSGTSEPSTMYAYQMWADTTNGVMKLRNSANNAWITLYQLDGEYSTIALENGTAAAPSIYFKDSGTDTGIFSGGTDQVCVSTGGVERGRFDSSGRFLVGTSSARSGYAGGNNFTPYLQVEGNSDGTRFYSLTNNSNANAVSAPILNLSRSRSSSIGGTTVVQNDDWLGTISFNGYDGTNPVEAVQIKAEVDGTPGTNDMPGRLVFSTTADGASSPTERFRIANTGKGSYFSSSSSGFQFSSSPGAGTSENIIEGFYGATGVATGTLSFLVRTNGNVLNANNSYGSLSDLKLKENIVDATSQWSDIKALQVRKYNFKEGQTHTQIGLIAQEVELVSPGLVSESPDRDEEGNDLGTVTKSVNYSVLYMKAVKALQEAMERIEQLETEMAEVKAQLS